MSRIKQSENTIFNNNDLLTFQSFLLTEGEPGFLVKSCHALGTIDNWVLSSSSSRVSSISNCEFRFNIQSLSSVVKYLI